MFSNNANLNNEVENLKQAVDRAMQAVLDASTNQAIQMPYYAQGCAPWDYQLNDIRIQLNDLQSKLGSLQIRISTLETLEYRILRMETVIRSATTQQLADLNDHLGKM